MFSTSRKANNAARLIFALSSFASTRAADIIDINGSVAYREATAEKGPWGEDLSEFNKLLDDSPTAMGYNSFRWYNVSTTATELTRMDGWSWNLTIKGDMPVSGIENAADHPKDHVYTGGKLSFQAPQELLKPDGSGLVVNDEWKICLVRWDLGGQLYNQGLRTDLGSCGVLTDKCETALRDRLRPSTGGDYAESGWCKCPRAEDVPECAGDDLGPWNSRCHTIELNAQKLRALKGGSVDLLTFASADLYAADGAANGTVYNDLGSIAWPFMAIQVAGDSHGFMSSTKTACVRAKFGVRGWDTPASNGTAPRDMAGSQDGRKTDGEGETGKSDGEAGKDGGEVKDSAASGPENRRLSAALLGVACLAWTLLV